DAAASPWGAVDRRSRVVTCGRTPTTPTRVPTPTRGAEFVRRCGVRAGPGPNSAPGHEVGGWGGSGAVEVSGRPGRACGRPGRGGERRPADGSVIRLTSIRTRGREDVPSFLVAPIAQSAERLHGKEKV